MADFVSNFWHWMIVIVTIVGIVILLPFIYINRGNKPSGEVETTGHTWDDDLQEYNNPLPGWWLNMFVITIIFGLIYLILYPGLGHYAGVLGWSSLGQYEKEIEQTSAKYDPLFQQYAATDIKELSKDKGAMKTGERLFVNYCATCHGSDARGAKGFPNLRDNDWLYNGDPAQIEMTILNGRSGVMPPWQSALGDDGVEQVTNFVLSLSGRDHDAGLAKQGQERYLQMCAACHQPDGTGNPVLGAPNLTDRIWLYGGSAATISQSISVGRIGQMPAHREFLGEDRVHLLAAYVHSLSQEYEQD